MTGDELRRLRLKAGASQAELARRMGVTRPCVSRLETGVDPIGLERAYAIAQALDVDPGLVDPRFKSARISASVPRPGAGPKTGYPAFTPAHPPMTKPAGQPAFRTEDDDTQPAPGDDQ
jgi:transcriptional regulator with XRE-family HTH domain